MYEGPNEVIVKVDAPGFAPDDLTVSLSDNLLTIIGERKYEVELGDRDYDLHERRVGDFCRKLTIPAAVDAGKAQASYREGVLEIRLPKAQEFEGRKISINIT
jgi:HSP20 family protein